MIQASVTGPWPSTRAIRAGRCSVGAVLGVGVGPFGVGVGTRVGVQVELHGGQQVVEVGVVGGAGGHQQDGVDPAFVVVASGIDSLELVGCGR